jgi:CheY-like chemotaxis protein
MRARPTPVPAVAVTAYARPGDRMKTLAAGFQEHVAKPIDSDTFVAVIAATARSDRLHAEMML